MNNANVFVTGATVIILFALIALGRAVMAVRKGLEEKAANLEYEAGAWAYFFVFWCGIFAIGYFYRIKK
jgi:hypothetical protein